MDWETLLGHSGKTLEQFPFKITLTVSEVVFAGRREDAVPQALCGQDSALILWDRKRVPHHGEDYQPPSGGSKQQRNWGRLGHGMAPGGVFETVFLSIRLDLIYP